MVQILGHANAHGRAHPAGHRVQDARPPSALVKAGRDHQKGRVSDQRHGIEGDADRIEQRSQVDLVRVGEEQAGCAQNGKGQAEGGGGSAPRQQQARGQGSQQVQRSGSPEVRVAAPCAGLELGGVLDDVKSRGIEPDQGRKPGQREDEGQGSGLPRQGNQGLALRLHGAAVGHHGGGEAQQPRDNGNGGRAGVEQRRDVAQEVAKAGAEADLDQGVPVSNPLGQVADEGDGEDAKREADDQRDAHGRYAAQGQQREPGRPGATQEAGLQAALGAGPEGCSGHQQAHGNTAQGHGRQDGLEFGLADTQFGEPGEKAKLRKDQKIRIGRGQEQDALPAVHWAGLGGVARYSNFNRHGPAIHFPAQSTGLRQSSRRWPPRIASAAPIHRRLPAPAQRSQPASALGR